jgi:hypothetical protein
MTRTRSTASTRNQGGSSCVPDGPGRALREGMNARVALLLLPLVIAGSSSVAAAGEPQPLGPVPLVTGNAIASLALANVGGMACATNTLGGTAFGSAAAPATAGSPSTGAPTSSRWVWADAGVDTSTGSMRRPAASTSTAQNNGTLSNYPPSVGDAVVFDYSGRTASQITSRSSRSGQQRRDSIETVSGDWGRQRRDRGRVLELVRRGRSTRRRTRRRSARPCPKSWA